MTATPPIFAGKHHAEASAFTPESLLREARRQKALPAEPVPEVCLLDPDGDVLRHLRAWVRQSRIPGGPATTVISSHSHLRAELSVSCPARSLCWWPSSSSPPAASARQRDLGRPDHAANGAALRMY